MGRYVDRQNVTHENPYDIFNIKSQTNSREMNARNQFEASNSVADDVPQLSYFRSACSSWLEAGGWKVMFKETPFSIPLIIT